MISLKMLLGPMFGSLSTQEPESDFIGDSRIRTVSDNLAIISQTKVVTIEVAWC